MVCDPSLRVPLLHLLLGKAGEGIQGPGAFVRHELVVLPSAPSIEPDRGEGIDMLLPALLLEVYAIDLQDPEIRLAPVGVLQRYTPVVQLLLEIVPGRPKHPAVRAPVGV